MQWYKLLVVFLLLPSCLLGGEKQKPSLLTPGICPQGFVPGVGTFADRAGNAWQLQLGRGPLTTWPLLPCPEG